MAVHHVEGSTPALWAGESATLILPIAVSARETARALLVHGDVMDDVANLVPAGQEFSPVGASGLGSGL